MFSETDPTTLEQMMAHAASVLRPKERLTVSQAAEKYRYVNVPGSFVGQWDNDTSPYLTEIMDETGSDEKTAVIFAGPARCGKSDIFKNLLLKVQICDPKDIILYHMTRSTAREWSMMEFGNLYRNSKELRELLKPGKDSDNTFDKQFINGTTLLIKYPVIEELSGKTIPIQWLMDYDRMPQDIEGEGSPFDLAKKRGTTFKDRAMCVAESSPGFYVASTNTLARTPHEAPPTEGILALYNRGDRRRFYWRCYSCGTPFEPSFKLMKWPESSDVEESAQNATMYCPHCGTLHGFKEGKDGPGRHQLNIQGRWVKDGAIWLPDGRMGGNPVQSKTASFWLKGPAASFTTWADLVRKYLDAKNEEALTGLDTALKATINVDQGEPYSPSKKHTSRSPESVKQGAVNIGHKTVPAQGRFLVATIDVQKVKFVVQIHAIGEGDDTYVIDRFDIKYSKREDAENPGQFKWVRPGSYKEDWYLIAEQVLSASYPLADETGRRMAVKQVMCDSGGDEGATANAYHFVRWLRAGPSDDSEDSHGWTQEMASRFMLVKGRKRPDAPRVETRYPDSSKKDKYADARGDIPVLFINSNQIKDMLNTRLDREEYKGGKVIFANWLPDSVYAEVTAEYRDDRGQWNKPQRARNETWDLLCYCIAATLMPTILTERETFWEEPPDWAEEWDENVLVFNPENGQKPFQVTDEAKSLTKLGTSLW